MPTLKDVDLRLVVGASLFGIGWGLSGFCPGPAIVSLPLLAKGTLIFIPCMLAGSALARLITQANRARLGEPTPISTNSLGSSIPNVAALTAVTAGFIISNLDRISSVFGEAKMETTDPMTAIVATLSFAFIAAVIFGII